VSTSFGSLITLGGIRDVTRDFDAIVCCAKEHAPGAESRKPERLAIMHDRPWGAEGPIAHYLRLDDHRLEMRRPEQRQLVEYGAKVIKEHLDKGQRVLVHCHRGLNRSALVLGRALMLSPVKLTGKQAVALIRQFRRGTFSNEAFAKYLETLR
jgi:protein-tyrosine phosphatase